MLRLSVVIVLFQSCAAFLAVGTLVRAVDHFQGNLKLNSNFSIIFAAGSFALLGAILTIVEAAAHYLSSRRGSAPPQDARESLSAPLAADGTPAAPPRWRVNVGSVNRASESTADWRHMYTGE